MDFRIRPATEGDYEQLNALFGEVDAMHRQAAPHVFQEPAGPARAWEYIATIMSNEDAALLVAERNDHLIGLVHVLIRETPDFPIIVPRRYAVIDNLVVTQGFRRRGVGQALVEAAHRWAADKKAVHVELKVWEFNRTARAFYKSLGFTTASRKMWKPVE